MEDGLDLLRAWLRPDVEAGVPASGAGAGPPTGELEAAFLSSLARARAFGARDVDVRVGPDPETGRFTEVVIGDVARGLSLTRLRAWLTDGTPPVHPERDWTLPGLRGPLGPPGFTLARFRTHRAGQTVEAWVLADGTWELHVRSDNVPGNLETWYLPEPGPGETLDRLRVALREGLSPHGELRVHLQGERVQSEPAGRPLLEVRHLDDATGYRLELVARPDGDLVLSHGGLVFFRGPCPIPHLSFHWDGIYRPGCKNPAMAVERDLETARRDLGIKLIELLTKGEAGGDAWRCFLAGHPEPAWRLHPLGCDLRGRSFTTRDLVEGVALSVSAAATWPPADPEFRLLDGRLWPAATLHALRRQEASRTGAPDEPGQAARRLRPDEDHPCARWSPCWEREAARDPRLAFDHGLVFCELHRPEPGAWPFFPARGSWDLVRLQTLPETWDRHGALWVAVNHPLVVRLAARCTPGDAVRLLATLVLWSQDEDPMDV